MGDEGDIHISDMLQICTMNLADKPLYVLALKLRMKILFYFFQHKIDGSVFDFRLR